VPKRIVSNTAGEDSRRLAYLYPERNQPEGMRPRNALHGRVVRGVRHDGKSKRLGEFPDQSITQLTGVPRHPVLAATEHADGSVTVDVVLHQAAYGPPGWGSVPLIDDPVRTMRMHLRPGEWDLTPVCWYTVSGGLVTVYSDEREVDVA
jgi:hypothetical protein